MTRKFPSILPSDPQAKILYDRFRNKTIAANTYLKDPDYLRLYRQYIVSLEAYARAIKEACAVFAKAHLPGPRRQIDLYKLETARRFYERDSYRFFNYRPHIKGPRRPTTRTRTAKGYMKDAIAGQLFAKDKRVDQMFKQAKEEIEALCRDVWERYKKSPDPKSNEVKNELFKALELAQLSGVDSLTVEEIAEETSRLLSGTKEK